MTGSSARKEEFARRRRCRRRRMKIGYSLSAEQYAPSELKDQAQRARDAGFEALCISDHFHPWNEAQGNSPFV